MRVRVTAGVGAWIVGATTATGLSLFAVSYLSADPQSPQGATLSQAQVNQALASVTRTQAPGPSPSSGPSTAGPAQTAPATPPPSSSSSATGAPAAPTRSAPAVQPVQRRLSGGAGTVVAQCQDGLVYLVTWSPSQGYQAEAVQRGPARLATMVFTGNGHRVEFHIGCAAGTPALMDDDDGGVDH
ncbi:hypothetical protein [Catenulispora sp. GP43]|uniref:hypothetical protein n=1 Tax=Catenulispora sp. GP43 TaxID=3156263 RepID=UPI003518A002